MGYRIIYSGFSDKGNREINEDSYGTFSNGEKCCCVLCDGLGGHGMGDEASSLVVKVFEDMFSKKIHADIFLPYAFSAAQDILLADQASKNAARKMKTTCTAFISDGKKAYIGHTGDSRLYIFRKNKVMKRTLDHSIPQMLVLSGEIKESEIRNHPDRSTVLRVMGVEWNEPAYELMPPVPLNKCQAFLLCSDGFWELINEQEMCSMLEKAETPEQWLSDMAAEVKMNGLGKNMDNYTAVAAWVVKNK